MKKLILVSFIFCAGICSTYAQQLKSASPEGECSAHYIDTATLITYTIQFQNTDTLTATHLSIFDTLDASLDITSFALLSYSDTAYTIVHPGNVVQFQFDSIMLPNSASDSAGSYGFITYQIQLLSGLADYTVVENEAAIYFDTATALYTNTVMHTVLNHTGSYHTSTDIYVTACDSFHWLGTSYTDSGSYTHTYTSSIGCDSVVTLNLIIYHSVYTSASAVACYHYTHDGITHSTSGNYHYTYTSSLMCDSTFTLHLTINDTAHETISLNACGTYTVGGITYDSSGTYIQSHIASTACDSILTIHLTISDTVYGSITTTSFCTYTLNAITYDSSGHYTQILTAASGCDSILTLNLTISDTMNTAISASGFCEVIVNGQLYTMSGMYTQTLSSVNGCDSILDIHVTIDDTIFASLTATACASFTLNGQTYTSSGVYAQGLTSAAGCDSILTIHLTINSVYSHTVTRTSCSSITINGIAYEHSGIYIQTFSTLAGCDSVLTLHLTINAIDSTVHQFVYVLNAAQNGASYQWLDCVSGLPISGETGQSYTATTLGTYAVIINLGSCWDTSICYNVTSLSIDETDNTSVHIYPNPANTEFVVELSTETASMLYITSMLGERIATIETGNEKRIIINTSHFAAGLYLLEVIKDDSRVNKPFVVLH